MKKKELYEYIKKRPEVFLSENPDSLKICGDDVPPPPPMPCDVEKHHKAEKSVSFKVAVALTAVLAIFVFFLTSPGQVVAKGIMQTIISWSSSESQVGILQGDFNDIDTLPEHFSSMEEIKACYKTIFAQNMNYEITSFEATGIENDSVSINLTYSVDNKQIVISQVLLPEPTKAWTAIETDIGQKVNVTFNGNIAAVGYVEYTSAIAMAYFDRLRITFIAENIDYDTFVHFIETTTIE